VGFWDGEMGSAIGGARVHKYGEFGLDVDAVGVVCSVMGDMEGGGEGEVGYLVD
jgi:hypothetical protein